MKAALLTRLPSPSLEIQTVPLPDIPPDGIEVTVEACGVCGTDLHILNGASYRPVLPFVMGHEPVGVVSKGPRELMGRRVVPSIFVGCGRCDPCRAGDERLCAQGPLVTGVLGPWGGFAEKMWLYPSQPVVVPEGLSPWVAAALVDAGATAHNAATLALHRQPRRVVVLGGGPVGFLTASILRSQGSEVVVVEPNILRRDLLISRGYDTLIRLDQADPTPSSVVVDCSGVPEAFLAALNWLPTHGCCLIVGYSEVPRVDFAIVSRKELIFKGVRSGRRDDLIAVLELAQRRAIDVPPVTTWPLEHINDALSALQSGQVAGKAVITVNNAIRHEC